MSDVEIIASMASGRPEGGETNLPVLDIFETFAKLVLSSMNEKNSKNRINCF